VQLKQNSVAPVTRIFPFIHLFWH